MFSIIPIISFVLIFLIFQKTSAVACWRGSFLSASITWGLLVTAITEFLSLVRRLDFWSVLVLWTLIAIIALSVLMRVAGRLETPDWRRSFSGFSRFELGLLAATVLIVLIVGGIGWMSPPNTWDSMTYHMSRIVHWIQNRSVEHYPTHILRQLHQNPLAEYIAAQFQILSGSDRLANLVQWFSLIGATLGVSLLAKKLGADLRGQVLSAVINVTIPMGILQGSSTQNDYLVSFWLVCLIYFAFLVRESGRFLYAVALGISLGLAILTKATAYLYAFPILVWVGLALIKAYRTKAFPLLLLAAIIAVTINTGHYIRNYSLYGNPLGPNQEYGGFKYSNEVVSVSAVTSNVIRNIGLHIGTPSDRVNHILETQIGQLHKVMGIDLNDARTTWPGTEFEILKPSLNEDWAANHLHLFSVFAAIMLLLFTSDKARDAFSYFACLIGAFLLFSGYLKWQPWHTRLQLPLFVLWSPLLGLLFSRIKYHWISNLYCVVLLLGTGPYLLFNDTRPLIGQESILVNTRTNLYFKNQPSLTKSYVGSTRFLSKTSCSDIGLLLSPEDWEYPFWVLLSQDGKRRVRLEHVNVANVSQVKYNEEPFHTFIPCAVIVLNAQPPAEVQLGIDTYARQWFSEPVSVYMQK